MERNRRTVVITASVDCRPGTNVCNSIVDDAGAVSMRFLNGRCTVDDEMAVVCPERTVFVICNGLEKLGLPTSFKLS